MGRSASFNSGTVEPLEENGNIQAMCDRATDIKCSSAVLRQIRHPMIPSAREFINRSRWCHFAIALYSRFPSLDPTIAFFRFSICRGILNLIREFRFHPNMAVR